ncbi:MAG: hypothetical protein MJ252_01240 [archaeon]|nr:hypothetical protein [archaeon]
MNLLSSNNFCYVDLNTAYLNLLGTELPLSENYPNTFNPVKSKYYIDCSKDLNKERNKVLFGNISCKIEEQIKIFKKNSSEDIFILFDFIMEEDELNNILKFSIENSLNTVFTLNLNLNEKKVIEYMKYVSDFKILFKKNESGSSKDIDGLIQFDFGFDKYNSDIVTKKICNLRFSILDNGIKFFTHLTI